MAISATETQTLLKSAGFYDDVVDGNFGPKSKGAVENVLLKYKNELPLGNSLWSDERKRIAAVQILLKFNGFDTGGIDGVDGPLTDKEFQMWATPTTTKDNMERKIDLNFSIVKILFGSAIKQNQVDGIHAILDGWNEKYASLPKEYLAYSLATAYHETAKTMIPIAEYGKGRSRRYGNPTKYNNQIAYGRGYVQLTWDYNYEKADRELKLNGALLNDFNLALDPKIASEIMFEGMISGWFTGKKLSNYFSSSIEDPRNARRIINGLDRADDIAKYYITFKNSLIG